jgi:ketosteroid isomerase-like protein
MERGESLELMPEFYADNASAQENGQAPRVGLATLIEHERRALARMRFERARASSVIVDGERVAINWVFELVASNGARFTLDEIAYQEWRDGKIVRERYYYDPSQLAPPKA